MHFRKTKYFLFRLEEMEEKVDQYSICESYLLEVASLLPTGTIIHIGPVIPSI